MDVLSVYEYILSRISEDLTPYGYQRSGKSALFYRYSIDKKIGCAFEMQKSINNCTDYYRFTFNIGCICLPSKAEFKVGRIYSILATSEVSLFTGSS